MITVLCRLLGKLLLLLVVGYELLQRLRDRLNALARRSYDLWRGDAARELHERRVLAECRSQLTKTPQHLVLVISPSDGYVDALLLRRIFGFALDVGVKHVSVYDKRTRGRGFVELAELCQSASEDGGRCFKWPPSPSKPESESRNGQKTNGYANGASGSHLNQKQLQVSVWLASEN